jgi:hypothetical protein
MFAGFGAGGDVEEVVSNTNVPKLEVELVPKLEVGLVPKLGVPKLAAGLAVGCSGCARLNPLNKARSSAFGAEWPAVSFAEWVR